MGAFHHSRLSARDVALMASHSFSTILLPMKNPLSHENKNNGQLLENAITLEREGIFTIVCLANYLMARLLM